MKINILVDDDKCWNLNIVRRLFPILKKKNIIIDHIWILPNKLANLKKNEISMWYLKTFGIIVFIKLSIFYTLVVICNFFNKVNSFKDLALKHDINYDYVNSTNSKLLFKNIDKKNKKVSLLLTNHILKINIINKKKTLFYK